MQNWDQQQSVFYSALCMSERPVPHGIVRYDGQKSERRFNVYRNNVMCSLIESLREGFVMVEKLLGHEYFGALAQIYVQDHLPKSPIMLDYGDDFADFIDQFPPLAEYPYLGDVARFEFMHRQSQHGADHKPWEILRDDITWLDSPVPLAPTAQWLVSSYPIYDLWQQHDEQLETALEMKPQSILMTRQNFRMQIDLLPGGGDVFFDFIAAGKTPNEACAEIMPIFLESASVLDKTDHAQDIFIQLFKLVIRAAGHRLSLN